MTNLTDIELYNKKIKKVIITEDEIKTAIKRAGREISEKYQGKPLLLISILKGAFIFLSDLCREVTIPCEIDFMSVSSYGRSKTSTGVVRILKDLDHDIQNACLQHDKENAEQDSGKG